MLLLLVFEATLIQRYSLLLLLPPLLRGVILLLLLFFGVILCRLCERVFMAWLSVTPVVSPCMQVALLDAEDPNPPSELLFQALSLIHI